MAIDDYFLLNSARLDELRFSDKEYAKLDPLEMIGDKPGEPITPRQYDLLRLMINTYQKKE